MKKLDGKQFGRGGIKNQLILGDNLQILREMAEESVDLIYIDPPFFSNRNYEVIWGDKGEIRSFTDRWAGGIMHYIDWLKERADELWRVLKAKGIICVHCDWHANAYIRTYILDKWQGSNFVNQITWQKIRVSKRQSISFGNVSDNIFVYSKSPKYIFNPQFVELSDARVKTHYNNTDPDGRVYQLADFTQAGQGEPKRFGDKLLAPPQGKHWIWSQERIDEGLKKGVIIFTSGGRPRVKRYLDESQGQMVSDIWTDIAPVNSQAKESLKYPTQKPEALLERIIKAFSNEGDIVLDAFCGGGTSIAVARRLGRRFIGIDQSVRAIAVSNARLENQTDLLINDVWEVRTQKYDRDKLFNMNSFEFESFIISQFGGEPNAKQRGDGGKDGVKRENGVVAPIQVKQQESAGRPDMQKFIGHLLQSKAKKGYFIAFSFAKSAVEYVAEIKQEHGIEIQLVKVGEIVPLIKPPLIKLDWTAVSKGDKHEITFTATGENIDLWQWDWDYDFAKGFAAEVVQDKDGRQVVEWKAGSYLIAVRAVDKDGISAVETLKIRVNGGVYKE